MTTATTTFRHAPKTARETKGWFAKVLERITHAQMMAVQKQMSDHLRTYSDASLTSIGFTKAKIAKLRAGATVQFPDYTKS